MHREVALRIDGVRRRTTPMKKTLAAVLLAACAFSMTVADVSAATTTATTAPKPAATQPAMKTTHKMTAHDECVSMHMGKTKSKTAMAKAEKWCKANHDSTKKTTTM